MKTIDNRFVWRVKTVAGMGQINLNTRVKPSQKGYNRKKENREWKKDY